MEWLIKIDDEYLKFDTDASEHLYTTKVYKDYYEIDEYGGFTDIYRHSFYKTKNERYYRVREEDMRAFRGKLTLKGWKKNFIATRFDIDVQPKDKILKTIEDYKITEKKIQARPA